MLLMKGEAVKNQEKRRLASRKNKCLEQSTAVNRRQAQPANPTQAATAAVRPFPVIRLKQKV
jgi:hypothetical protein